MCIRDRLSEKDIPKGVTKVLGSPGKQWVNNLIAGIFKASNSGKIDMDEEVLKCMNELRDFMFEKVYLREETKEERIKAKSIIEKLVYTFETDPSLMPENYHNDQSNLENAIDYVAGMTDRYAIKKHSEL